MCCCTAVELGYGRKEGSVPEQPGGLALPPKSLRRGSFDDAKGVRSK